MRFEPGEDERYGLRNGDVLVCEGGEPGRAAVWRDERPDMRFQKALHRVRCSEALLPEWLVMVLQAHAQSRVLADYFTGSGIAHLTGVSLAKVPVPLPPVVEQLEIVRLLQAFESIASVAESQVADATRRIDSIVDALMARLFRTHRSVIVEPEIAPGPEMSTANNRTSQVSATDPSRNDGSIEAVRALILELSADQYTFEDLQRITALDYEPLQQVIFSLLDETNPIVRQVFDQTAGTIVYVRQTT